MRKGLVLVGSGAIALMAGSLAAQHGAPTPPASFVPPSSYPSRQTDPAAAARGKTLFVANGCSFCHGADARGGNGGPSLLRSQKVLADQKGEVIGDILAKGVPGTAMPAFKLQPAEVADVAEFLHSFTVAGYDATRLKPAVFTMGNARAGQRYFGANCAGCHSATGDLKGYAGKFQQPRDMQQAWLLPPAKSKTAVTVTPVNGAPVSGSLVRIDEFLVTLTLAGGSQRTFTRDGDTPKVELRDPNAPHLALLRRYSDTDIHDVTAYLASLK